MTVLKACYEFIERCIEIPRSLFDGELDFDLTGLYLQTLLILCDTILFADNFTLGMPLRNSHIRWMYVKTCNLIEFMINNPHFDKARDSLGENYIANENYTLCITILSKLCDFDRITTRISTYQGDNPETALLSDWLEKLFGIATFTQQQVSNLKINYRLRWKTAQSFWKRYVPVRVSCY